MIDYGRIAIIIVAVFIWAIISIMQILIICAFSHNGDRDERSVNTASVDADRIASIVAYHNPHGAYDDCSSD